MKEEEYLEAMFHLMAFAEVVKTMSLSEGSIQDVETALRSIRTALIFEVMKLV